MAQREKLQRCLARLDLPAQRAQLVRLGRLDRQDLRVFKVRLD